MYSIRLSEFAKLSDEAQAAVLDAACRSVVSSDAEDLGLIMGRIRELEVKHGMLSSEDMKRMLAQGELRETELVCEWLILLDAAERVRRAAEKQSSRAADAAALASGEITRQQLGDQNQVLRARNVVLDLDAAVPLEPIGKPPRDQAK